MTTEEKKIVLERINKSIEKMNIQVKTKVHYMYIISDLHSELLHIKKLIETKF